MNTKNLTRSLAVATPAHVLDITQGRRPVAEVQKVVRLEPARAGTTPELSFNGSSSPTAFNRDSLQASLNGLTGDVTHQVTEVDNNTWYFTFTDSPGIEQRQVKVTSPDTASQVAKSFDITGRQTRFHGRRAKHVQRHLRPRLECSIRLERGIHRRFAGH